MPIHDSEVRLAFFKEVGQQSDFQAVLEHDLVGANARGQAHRRPPGQGELQPRCIRRPATRLATAILMYSFGGLRREGGKEGEILPPGVTEAELLSVCVGPDLDSTTALACLKELKEQCLYLHFDGVRYCFKKDPNVTLLIEQEADSGRPQRQAGPDAHQGDDRGPARRPPQRHRLARKRRPTSLTATRRSWSPTCRWNSPASRAASRIRRQGPAWKSAARSRERFRNGLGLAIPAADQVEILRRAVRYLIAAEGVKAKAKQLNLTDEQRSQLRERESTEQLAAESALLKLYTEVWLPRAEEGGIGIEKIAAGGRPLQTTLNDKKQAMIHERIVELITQFATKVFDSVWPRQDRRAVPPRRRHAAAARHQHRRGRGRLLFVPRASHG